MDDDLPDQDLSSGRPDVASYSSAPPPQGSDLLGRGTLLDPQSNRVSIVGPVLSLVVGFVMLLAAPLFVIGDDDDIDEDRQVKVAGEVVEHVEFRNSDGDERFNPVVAFVDPATGETFEVTARFDVGSRPTVGDRYDVVYDRGAPRTAVVLDPGSDAAAWAVRAVAMLFIVGGLWRLLVKLGRLRAGLAEYRTAKELSGHTAEMPNEAAVVRRALLGGAPTTAPKTSPGGAPLGWYRDPVSGARPGDERWWDGARWTDHRRNLLADGA